MQLYVYVCHLALWGFCRIPQYLNSLDVQMMAHVHALPLAGASSRAIERR